MGKHDVDESKQYKALVLARGHGIQADKFHLLHYWIGVPLILLTASMSTSAFATLISYGKAYPFITVVGLVLSLLATILAALQTFFDFGGKAVKHATAAAALSSLAGQEEITEEKITAAIRDAPRVPLKTAQAAQKAIDAEVPKKVSRGAGGRRRFVVNKRIDPLI